MFYLTMAPRPIKHRAIEKSRSAVYKMKADDFFESMRNSFLKQNWNASGLAGVHCAISATDALLVKVAGVRSTAESHWEVVTLLKEKIRHAGTDDQARRLDKILSRKNMIEYQDREFTQEEAYSLQKDVERYYSWVQDILSKQR